MQYVQSPGMLRKFADPLYILKALALFLACFLGSEAAVQLYTTPAISRSMRVLRSQA